MPGLCHTPPNPDPGEQKTAVAFRDRSQAAAFEHYLKFPSGRAFARKRL
jgi:hypothetical protein